MKEMKLIIKNKLGLHARAAALFVEAASKYVSDITVIKGNNEVDGKSIMGLMTLAAAIDTEITVIAEGSDESSAIEEIRELIDRKFDEE